MKQAVILIFVLSLAGCSTMPKPINCISVVKIKVEVCPTE